MTLTVPYNTIQYITMLDMHIKSFLRKSENAHADMYPLQKDVQVTGQLEQMLTENGPITDPCDKPFYRGIE